MYFHTPCRVVLYIVSSELYVNEEKNPCCFQKYKSYFAILMTIFDQVTTFGPTV